jgi:hypothetical protein
MDGITKFRNYLERQRMHHQELLMIFSDVIEADHQKSDIELTLDIYDDIIHHFDYFVKGSEETDGSVEIE